MSKDNTPTPGQRLVKVTSMLSGRYDEDDFEDVLTDVLSDLRHFAHANGLDFEEAVRISEAHFNEETAAC